MLKRLPYKDRAHLCLSSMGNKIFSLLDEKKTNLAVSADVTTADELIHLAEAVGDEICILKTHIDIIEDFTPDLTHALKALAQKHHFLLFEDRKFADIGNTVKHQYEGGVYHIADWADIVNAHTLPGPGIIEGLASAGRKHNRGLLLLAEMSSKGHLMDADYMHKTLKMAEQYSDFVCGFITQHVVSADPHWINITPGIQANDGKDSIGQQYITPEKAIGENGSDIIIVGRGIYKANDPKAAAKMYRERGWQAYLINLSS